MKPRFFKATGGGVLLLCLMVPGLATGRDADESIAERIPAVQVIEAKSSPRMQSRQFFGRVRARETVDLSFEVGGALEVLNAAEGARIEHGAVLARLDEAPFEREVERAELTLAQAEREFGRASSLAANDVASRARANDAETARNLASVALRDARAALDNATIKAPFDGLVAARLTPNYSNVTPGQPILRLHDMSEIRVEFDLPERLLMRVGDPVQARFSVALPDHPDPILLRFVEFRAETAAIGQSYTFTLAFPDTESLFLVPGASVTVTASLPPRLDGVVLPASAILSGPDRDTAVMVLDGPGGAQPRIRRQPVEVSSGTGTSFVVKGLPEGAEVVAIGAHLLREGQAVRRYTGLTVGEP